MGSLTLIGDQVHYEPPLIFSSLGTVSHSYHIHHNQPVQLEML